MSIFSVGQVLSLYAWFPLAIILSIYMLIARFYGRFSKRRTYYWLFAIPVVAYGASALRYASIDRPVHDFWGDLFAVVGGSVLLVMSTTLFWQMMRQRGGE